ncbi:MAG: GerAB/ArcD/ProY family transporter [Oscillospiraceae bacterium]|jgi:spore germination protein KB
MVKISLKQLLMLALLALMSPTVRHLPVMATMEAGYAAWFSPIAATVPLVIWGFILGDLLRREDEGYAQVLMRVLGGVAGRAVALAYFAWIVLNTSLAVRSYAERFLSTTYRGESIVLFIVVLLVLAAWIGRQPLRYFARTGQIFFWVFLGLLAFLFGLSAMDVNKKNILPVTGADILPVLRSVEPIMATAAFALYFAFLMKETKRIKRTGLGIALGFVGYGAISTILMILVLGVFGPEITRRMQLPFITLIKGLRIQGVFEHAESVILAVWVVTDLMLVTLGIMASERIIGAVFGLEEPEKNAAPLCLIIYALSIKIAPDAFGVEKFVENTARRANIILGVFVPLAVWIVFRIRLAAERKRAAKT